mmetsp:Transcript_36150/g.75984  ORF Transcript_36150/g.75984 Transcript_36150/m.75984 type:complete len:95 (-) Transcript_36150:32-316(-)
MILLNCNVRWSHTYIQNCSSRQTRHLELVGYTADSLHARKRYDFDRQAQLQFHYGKHATVDAPEDSFQHFSTRLQKIKRYVTNKMHWSCNLADL